MKYFVVSDLHGFYTKTIQALEKSGWDRNNENHKLIVAGDMIDGNNKEQIILLQWLKELHDVDKAIIIKGNHDYHFQIEPTRIFLNYRWQYDFDFMKSFSTEMKNWISSLPSSHQTKTHVITHGMWFPQLNKGGTFKHKIYASPNMITCDKKCWYDTSYMNSFEKDVPWKTVDEYTNDLIKKVVIGHFWTPNFRYGHHCGINANKKTMEKYSKEDWDIWKSKDGKLIAIDGGVYFEKGKINVYTFEEV